MDIVFEDEFIVIVNKQPGVLTVPTPKNEKYTLTNLLNEEFKKRGSSVKILPCHRLDRDTSGLIIYAKGRDVQDKVMEEFKKGKVKKTYIAFVQGKISRREGTIGYPIEGKPAITQYKVLKKDMRGFSVIELHTLTGRTNQVRLHFKMIGHPLLGERKFAFGKDYALKFRRVALHATRLLFTHPVSKKILDFTSDLPKDMEDFLNR
jgi:23S rRNA pseudouridine1911/1915/1917 synthase